MAAPIPGAAVRALLPTHEMAQILRLHPRELHGLARLLGLRPGIDISYSPAGKLQFRRVWERTWLPELQAALDATPHLDLTDLRGLAIPDPFSTDTPAPIDSCSPVEATASPAAAPVKTRTSPKKKRTRVFARRSHEQQSSDSATR